LSYETTTTTTTTTTTRATGNLSTMMIIRFVSVVLFSLLATTTIAVFAFVQRNNHYNNHINNVNDRFQQLPVNDDNAIGNAANSRNPILFISKKSYLDDVARDKNNDGDDEKDQDKFVLKQYLEDSKYKDPETYLEDMSSANKNKDTSGNVTESSSASTSGEYLSDATNKEAETYLEDMASTKIGKGTKKSETDPSEFPQRDYLDKTKESSESNRLLEEANEILMKIETEEAFEKSIEDSLTLE
jgi:hypothetical protein